MAANVLPSAAGQGIETGIAAKNGLLSTAGIGTEIETELAEATGAKIAGVKGAAVGGAKGAGIKGATAAGAKGAGIKGAAAAGAKGAGIKGAVAGGAKGAGIKAAAGTGIGTVGTGQAGVAAGTAVKSGGLHSFLTGSGSIWTGKGLGLGFGLTGWGTLLVVSVAALAVYGIVRKRAFEAGQSEDDDEVDEAVFAE